MYAGLTASGYDIAQTDSDGRIAAVARAIVEAPWPARVLDYFRKARATTCEVNPYWPRAYMLVAAALHTSSAPNWDYSDPEQVENAVRAMPVDPIHRDPRSIEWLMNLPDVVRQMAAAPWFGDTWASYVQAVTPVIPLYAAAGERALAAVACLGVPSRRMPRIVIVPNLLQAWQIADTIVVQEALYVILARPDPGPIVHEAFHSLFAPALECAGCAVDAAIALYTPLRDQMVRMGYAWDNSPASWRRVWEESLVRAAAIWAEWGDCPARAASEAEADAGMGFAYVPQLIRCFGSQWRGIDDMSGFILVCLDACARSERLEP